MSFAKKGCLPIKLKNYNTKINYSTHPTFTLLFRELDTLAEKFARASSKEDREKIVFAAESWAKEKGEDALVYVKIMKAALDTGYEGIEKEVARVEKVMDNKASDKVKSKMSRKMNVLSSFVIKDEL